MISRTDANYDFGFGKISANAETRAERSHNSSINEHVSFKKLLQDKFEMSGAPSAPATYTRSAAGGNKHRPHSTDFTDLAALKSANNNNSVNAAAVPTASSATETTSGAAANAATAATDCGTELELIQTKDGSLTKSAFGIAGFLNEKLGINISAPPVLIIHTPLVTDCGEIIGKPGLHIGSHNKLSQYYDRVMEIADALINSADNDESLNISGSKMISPEEAREISAYLKEQAAILKEELDKADIFDPTDHNLGEYVEPKEVTKERALKEENFVQFREPTGITGEGSIQDLLRDLIDSLNLYSYNIPKNALDAFEEYRQEVQGV